MRIAILTAAAALLAAGCNNESGKPKGDAGKPPRADKPSGTASASGDATALDRFLLKAEPTGEVRQVKEVRDNAKDGEEVLVAGRVQDFVEDRAMFVLIDNSLTPCNEKPGDACKTPWDYCCDPPDVQKIHKFAVKLADPSGAVIKTPLAGTLHRLDKVVVRGKVSKTPDGSVSVVAAGIYNRGGGVN
jgi:hypothetical protein